MTSRLPLRAAALAVVSLAVAAGVVAAEQTGTAPVAANAHGLAVQKNPYTGQADAIAQGKDLFISRACSSCHGAGGAGGMCPPLVNDAWVYGSDDTTLFNLIKLGSSGLQAKGYVRGGREKAAGDMPPLAGVVSDDEAWKLIAYVRSKYAGDPALRDW